jgi:hypothetical protein
LAWDNLLWAICLYQFAYFDLPLLLNLTAPAQAQCRLQKALFFGDSTFTAM